jgi:hypothetical protein
MMDACSTAKTLYEAVAVIAFLCGFGVLLFSMRMPTRQGFWAMGLVGVGCFLVSLLVVALGATLPCA